MKQDIPKEAKLLIYELNSLLPSLKAYVKTLIHQEGLDSIYFSICQIAHLSDRLLTELGADEIDPDEL